MLTPTAIVRPAPDAGIIRAAGIVGRLLEDLPDGTLVQPLDPATLQPLNAPPVELPCIRSRVGGGCYGWDADLQAWARRWA